MQLSAAACLHEHNIRSTHSRAGADNLHFIHTQLRKARALLRPGVLESKGLAVFDLLTIGLCAKGSALTAEPMNTYFSIAVLISALKEHKQPSRGTQLCGNGTAMIEY